MKRFSLLAVVASLAMAACGGGGSEPTVDEVAPAASAECLDVSCSAPMAAKVCVNGVRIPGCKPAPAPAPAPSPAPAPAPSPAPTPGPVVNPVPTPPASGALVAPTIPVVDRGDVLLQVGDYWFEDGVWGAWGLTRTPASGYTGVNGTTYAQSIGVSPNVGAGGEVAGRMTWAVPIGQNEVKSFPSFVAGKKPGWSNPWIGPGGIPILLTDGTQRQTYPVGPTPNTFLPLQLPLAAPLYSTLAYQQNVVPVGRGHLSYDIWLQNTATQTQGFNSQKEIDFEVMIPITFWGGYGQHQVGRNPGWYDGDALVDGRLYHIYRAKNADGTWAPFAGGWKFVVFEPDQPMSQNQAQTLNLASFFQYMTGRGWTTNQWVSSIELGVETVEGTGDLTLYNFSIRR